MAGLRHQKLFPVPTQRLFQHYCWSVGGFFSKGANKDLVDLCHPIEPYQVTKNGKNYDFILLC
ncbi:MAG: hypothetical protein EWV40_18900 [Microcystis flos-aquae Mf_WU_F_19750830_S460]|uniref:Uncharacterized protein n=1 Tax=Microcystis flos-aquae Mf_WU_F_19750830_S460 TaxID=2486237 RepID=A0A552LAP4_9CHRO|nr:MAG: hypothetical protein EWV40_18900 [Microcystis flos-aquae Mf_WU_F_19750830_S460]